MGRPDRHGRGPRFAQTTSSRRLGHNQPSSRTARICWPIAARFRRKARPPCCAMIQQHRDLCSSRNTAQACHSHANEWGEGIQAEKPSAPNLYGFASRQWLVGLFDPDRIAGSHYFGKTKFEKGEMVQALTDHYDTATTTEETNALRGKFEKVAWALSAEAALPQQSEQDHDDREAIAAGRQLLTGRAKLHRLPSFSWPRRTGRGSRSYRLWIKNLAARHDRQPATRAVLSGWP